MNRGRKKSKKQPALTGLLSRNRAYAATAGINRINLCTSSLSDLSLADLAPQR
jgi:hypothetical protein